MVRTKSKGTPEKIKLKAISIIVVLAFLGLSLGLFLYNYFSIVDVKFLNMSISVVPENIIGINLDSDAIYFDKTPAGGLSKRFVTVENNFPFEIVVNIKVQGNIAPMVTVSENDFFMAPGEKKSLTYFADTAGMPEGNYTGVTTVVFKRVFIK